MAGTSTDGEWGGGPVGTAGQKAGPGVCGTAGCSRATVSCLFRKATAWGACGWKLERAGTQKGRQGMF